jgi:hypothetical protein
MSSNIKPGQKIRVSVRFVDYDFFANTDELLDPATVTGALYKYSETTNVYVLQSVLTPIVQQSIGIYYYDWTPVEDGKFKLIFTGTLPGATPSQVTNERTFYIGTAEPTITLGETVEYNFLGELTPLYLDPSVVKTFYSDVDFVEATEIIYRISLEIQDWFGENVEITSQIEEYILASVMCELSKIHYFGGGIGGFTTASEYMLGDLQVKRGAGTSNSRNSLYRGNAANWCELASLLRDELMWSRNNMKSVVRGSAWDNPMPERKLRRFD